MKDVKSDVRHGRRGVRQGEYYRGFKVTHIVPDRCGWVVEATCPEGHACVCEVSAMACPTCREANEIRSSYIGPYLTLKQQLASQPKGA